MRTLYTVGLWVVIALGAWVTWTNWLGPTLSGEVGRPAVNYAHQVGVDPLQAAVLELTTTRCAIAVQATGSELRVTSALGGPGDWRAQDVFAVAAPDPEAMVIRAASIDCGPAGARAIVFGQVRTGGVASVLVLDYLTPVSPDGIFLLTIDGGVPDDFMWHLLDEADGAVANGFGDVR